VPLAQGSPRRLAYRSTLAWSRKHTCTHAAAVGGSLPLSLQSRGAPLLRCECTSSASLSDPDSDAGARHSTARRLLLACSGGRPALSLSLPLSLAPPGASRRAGPGWPAAQRSCALRAAASALLASVPRSPPAAVRGSSLAHASAAANSAGLRSHNQSQAAPELGTRFAPTC
jgi:hypothetical protein